MATHSSSYEARQRVWRKRYADEKAAHNGLDWRWFRRSLGVGMVGLEPKMKQADRERRIEVYAFFASLRLPLFGPLSEHLITCPH